MALSSVKVIYETVGGQHIIKAVRGSEVADSELQAAVTAVTGWDGFATIAAAQLTTYDKQNELLGLEYYLNAGVPSVRVVVESAMYKIAERRPILEANLRRQISEVDWGMGQQFSKTRADTTARWLQKTAAVIGLGVVLSDDTDYSYLLADTLIDATQWMIQHDADTWPGYLHSDTEDETPVNVSWYRTVTSGDAWTGTQVAGISVSPTWYTKDLLAELVE